MLRGIESKHKAAIDVRFERKIRRVLNSEKPLLHWSHSQRCSIKISKCHIPKSVFCSTTLTTHSTYSDHLCRAIFSSFPNSISRDRSDNFASSSKALETSCMEKITFRQAGRQSPPKAFFLECQRETVDICWACLLPLLLGSFFPSAKTVNLMITMQSCRC